MHPSSSHLLDTGFLVRPKTYRAVLMDQDVTHRVSAPSPCAKGRPRYSLVWKLLFLPMHDGVCSIVRPEWGRKEAVAWTVGEDGA